MGRHSGPDPEPATPDRLRVATDILLEYAGTPRRVLFEYPHRDDDSREMIRRAESTAQRILDLALE